MNIVQVKVPQLSESVSEARILNWKKEVGDKVQMDDILVEIETDKVILEVPSPSTGILLKKLCEDESTVVTDQVIAEINEKIIEQDIRTEQNVRTGEEKVVGENQKHTNNTDPTVPVHNQTMVMKSAARIISENNLDPKNISGSGRSGRITKSDVVNSSDYKNSLNSKVRSTENLDNPKPQSITVANIQHTNPGSRVDRRIAMTKLRSRIAERLLSSQRDNAILTTFNEVDMSSVILVRSQFKAKFEKEYGVKLGFMSFFVKAVVYALRKYPVLNASVEKDEIIYHDYFDIGIAVGGPRGLVVPIIRDANVMSFADIEKKISEFGYKAQNNKLSLEELTGGTFSISNGGVFGSMMSTPIINPPQSAILGVHATKERAVAVNGKVEIRPMNYLALSYDHRIIDGKEAVLGLVSIKEALEDPMSLLMLN